MKSKNVRKKSEAKQSKKSQAKALKRTIKQAIQRERERVTYTYDAKRKCIVAKSTVVHKMTHVVKEYSVDIKQADIKRLAAVAHDQKRFRAITHAELNLVSLLHVDAKAKKALECCNTQYDSLKKLAALVLHISASKAQQTRKTKQVKSSAKAIA